MLFSFSLRCFHPINPMLYLCLSAFHTFFRKISASYPFNTVLIGPLDSCHQLWSANPTRLGSTFCMPFSSFTKILSSFKISVVTRLVSRPSKTTLKALIYRNWKIIPIKKSNRAQVLRIHFKIQNLIQFHHQYTIPRHPYKPWRLYFQRALDRAERKLNHFIVVLLWFLNKWRTRTYRRVIVLLCYILFSLGLLVKLLTNSTLPPCLLMKWLLKSWRKFCLMQRFNTVVSLAGVLWHLSRSATWPTAKSPLHANVSSFNWLSKWSSFSFVCRRTSL